MQRLEATASRLISEVSNYEAALKVCKSITPENPRLNEINIMVMKIIKNFANLSVSECVEKDDTVVGEDIELENISKHKDVLMEENLDMDMFNTPPNKIYEPCPSFSLGLTPARDVVTTSQIVQDTVPRSDCVLVPIVPSDAVCAKDTDVLEENVLPDMTDNIDVLKKREVKLPEALRSPYYERMIDLKKNQNVERNKIVRWILYSDDPVK